MDTLRSPDATLIIRCVVTGCKGKVVWKQQDKDVYLCEEHYQNAGEAKEFYRPLLETLPPMPTSAKIAADMAIREEIIRFDLINMKWRETAEDEWQELTPDIFMERLRHTHEILVPVKFDDWIVGQDEAKEKIRLNLVEWPRKLKDLAALEESGKEVSQILKERPGPFILMLGEPGTGKCITSTTPVILNDFDIGYPVWLWESCSNAGKDVVNISDTEQIIPKPGIDLYQQGEERLESRSVRAIYRQQYSGPIVRLKLNSGRYIDCTPQHRLLTENGWVRAGEIKEGMAVSIPTPTSPINGGKDTNPELAELLGYIISEGHAVEGRMVTVGNKDISLISRLEYLLDKYVWKWTVKETNGYKTFIFSGKALSHIENYFCNGGKWSIFGKSDRKQLPPRIMMADLNAIKAFVGAYIAGDGTVSDNAIEITTISQSLADHFSYLLMKLGILATVRKKTSRLSYGDNRQYVSYIIRLSASDNKKVKEFLHGGDKVERLTVRSTRKTSTLSDKVKSTSSFNYKGKYIYDFQMDTDNADEQHYIAGHNGGITTHNSLLIKVAAEYLKELYEKEGIGLYDVLAVKNERDDYRPKIRYAHAGEGRKIQAAANLALSAEEVRNAVFKNVLYFILMFGALLFSSGILMYLFYAWYADPVYAWWVASGTWLTWLQMGVFMMIFPMLILVLWMMRGMGMLGGGEKKTGPSLLVDNAEGKMWIDATVGNAAGMFGDIEWDPLGRSKPAHQRVKAGDVHRAHRKLLYFDEIKNLKEEMAIELLTVMEDGATHIAGHQARGSAHSASQMVKSDTKVGCQFFLIAAGNMDLLYDPMSILNRVTALRDRFEGYGDVILMNDEMDDSPLNHMKVAQVVTDECFRFNFPPVTRDGVGLLIDVMRKTSSSNKMLSMRFRQTIGILRRGAQLAWDQGSEFVTPEHIQHAINTQIPIEVAHMRQMIDKEKAVTVVENTGRRLGVVNGLAVRGQKNNLAGLVLPVAAYMKKVDDPDAADFIVGGIRTVEKDVGETWIKDSVKAVRTTILRLYGIDLTREYYTHISFAQKHGVDGPSAGTTMTLAVMSLLGDPDLPPEERIPVPIRQDIAITGTVEILSWGDEEDDVRVGPIGGAREKSLGAKEFGLKATIVPQENYDQNIDNVTKREIRIIPAKSVKEYFALLTGDIDLEGEWARKIKEVRQSQ